MVRIKTLKKISDKYVKNAGVAGAEWKDETKVNADHWLEKASSDISENNWGAATAAAAERGARRNRIKQKGTEKFIRNVEGKGQGNYTRGVKDAGKDQQEGFAPYHDVLERLTLSERAPTGSPSNIDIVREVSEALRAKKEALQAAGA